MAPGFAFLEHPGPLAFAHRGGSAEAPENSWAAFEHAVSLGYSYMETDVRATADGVAIALHDPAIERVTGRPGLVADMTCQQLEAAPLADGRPIPRLDDLLSAWPDLRWNIDVKRREAVAPVVEAIKRTGSKNRVLVAAFSGRRAAMVRDAVGDELATGAGQWTIAALLCAKIIPGPKLRLRAAAAQVPVRRNGITILDGAFLRVCRRSGLAVHVWTIDDPGEMARLLDLGVDGIMTDRPSLLKEVLQQRGQWS